MPDDGSGDEDDELVGSSSPAPSVKEAQWGTKRFELGCEPPIPPSLTWDILAKSGRTWHPKGPEGHASPLDPAVDCVKFYTPTSKYKSQIELKNMKDQMYFYFSDKVVLLFDFWKVHSPAGMVLSVVVIALLAVLYEAIKVAKAKVILRMAPAMGSGLSQETLREPDQGSTDTGTEQLAGPSRNPFPWHVSQTLLHVVQVILGYLVMLAVMSYNSWVFLGVIVGSTAGYYLAYPFLAVR